MRIRWNSLILPAVAALVLASCGSDEPRAADEPQEATNATQQTPEPTESDAVAEDVAWAGDAENASAMMALYDAAVDAGESQVVIYGAFAEAYQPLWDIFGDRFGDIEIVGVPLSGAQLHAKLDAEFTSGRHEGDVLMTGLVETPAQAEQGRLISYQPVDTFGLPDNLIEPEYRYIVHFGEVYGVTYNTNELSEDELPTSLEELVDATYSGMVMDEPLSSGLTDLMGIELHRSGKLDPALWRGIVENAQIVTRTAEYYTQLTAGSVSMMPWGSHSRYRRLMESGAPVGFAVTPGMAAFIPGATGIVDGGPNPNAAKLLQSWFLTPEAQLGLSTAATAYGLVPGAERPSDWPEIEGLLAALAPIDPAGYAAARADYEEFARSALE